MTLRLLLTLLAVVVALAATPTGVDTTWDSLGYISVSDHLLRGQGVYTDDGPHVLQPPLYPVLLTLLRLPGLDALQAAHVGNILAFGLTAYLLASLLPGRNAMAGILAFLAGAPLFYGSQRPYAMAWSEPLFIVLSLAALAQIGRRTLASAALVALACLTRYVGVTLILSGAIWLLWERRPLRVVLLFTVVAAAPLATWLVRNYLVSGTIMGERTASLFPFAVNLRRTGMQLLTWALNPVLLANCILSLHYHHACLRMTPHLLFSATYLAVLIAAASLSHFDAISARLMAPAFVTLFATASLLFPPFAHAANHAVASEQPI